MGERLIALLAIVSLSLVAATLPPPGILPGGSLYWLDVSGEWLEDVFAFSTQAQVATDREHAQERLAEINALYIVAFDRVGADSPSVKVFDPYIDLEEYVPADVDRRALELSAEAHGMHARIADERRSSYGKVSELGQGCVDRAQTQADHVRTVVQQAQRDVHKANADGDEQGRMNAFSRLLVANERFSELHADVIRCKKDHGVDVAPGEHPIEQVLTSGERQISKEQLSSLHEKQLARGIDRYVDSMQFYAQVVDHISSAEELTTAADQSFTHFAVLESLIGYVPELDDKLERAQTLALSVHGLTIERLKQVSPDAGEELDIQYQELQQERTVAAFAALSGVCPRGVAVRGRCLTGWELQESCVHGFSFNGNCVSTFFASGSVRNGQFEASEFDNGFVKNRWLHIDSDRVEELDRIALELGAESVLEPIDAPVITDTDGLYCGDGICDISSECGVCASDCGSCDPEQSQVDLPEESEMYCGDGICDVANECGVCEQDCAGCQA